jgi:cell division septal protein FtsQ
MRRRGRGPGPGRGPARRSVVRRHRRMRRRMRRRMVVAGAVIIAVGTSAVKMTPTEVQQAMSDLGIEGQEPTDQEVAMLEAEEDKNPSV